MMGPLFAGDGIPAMGIEAGADAFLHGFHHFFVLVFDGVETGTSALVVSGFIGDPCTEGNGRFALALRFYDVDAKSPWIKIEHEVGENEEVVSRDIFPVVGRVPWQIEYFFVVLCDAELQVGIGKEFGGVVPKVDDGVKAGMDEGNMKAFEVVLAVEGPVGVDGEVAG